MKTSHFRKTHEEKSQIKDNLIQKAVTSHISVNVGDSGSDFDFTKIDLTKERKSLVIAGGQCVYSTFELHILLK